MEYDVSIRIQTPIFILCNSCGLWFSAESGHCCTKNIDTIVYGYNIS